MVSVFSRIIAGELPARFVWKDESCVAFLSIRPLRPGHALVVPRAEIDHWLDLDTALLDHLFETAQAIGKAQMAGFKPARIGVMLAGLEVPHCHIHVVPIRGVHDLDFGNQDPNPDPALMDAAAQTLRSELRKLGYTEVSE
jgi:histidine triad (HIT) family protein